MKVKQEHNGGGQRGDRKDQSGKENRGSESKLRQGRKDDQKDVRRMEKGAKESYGRVQGEPRVAKERQRWVCKAEVATVRSNGCGESLG